GQRRVIDAVAARAARPRAQRRTDIALTLAAVTGRAAAGVEPPAGVDVTLGGDEVAGLLAGLAHAHQRGRDAQRVGRVLGPGRVADRQRLVERVADLGGDVALRAQPLDQLLSTHDRDRQRAERGIVMAADQADRVAGRD